MNLTRADKKLIWEALSHELANSIMTELHHKIHYTRATADAWGERVHHCLRLRELFEETDVTQTQRKHLHQGSTKNEDPTSKG